MMKRILIVLIAIMCGIGSQDVMAQKKKKGFSGTVKFSIKYEGEIDPQTLANLPTEFNYMVYDNNTKLTIDAGGFFQYVVSVGDSSQENTIIDHPMQKLVIKKSKEDFDEELSVLKYTVVPSDETKVICGYTCKRYDVTVENIEEGGEQKKIFYTTEEIGLDERINFDTPGLKGYTLYQEDLIGEIKIIYEATEVKKKKISPAEFLMPAGYQVLTYDQYIEAMRANRDGGQE